ncbi:hypothetical protein tloyanaT_13230 [Thalassotalea loyana]|uniref:Uncharacterized protein n=1 Tax=Thalassotalea loyana TaxID=280483 RepID=A0ABQ6HF04_9GAMM|nr:hypothetical protein [Thalassotalea loyana]GLX85071.1 hypothetical protein tloyanaT_13230 [Thalassotalea loyana]
MKAGDVFNNFTVLGEVARPSSNGLAYFRCKCVCGTIREVRKDNLGKVKGCGCQRKVYKKRMPKLIVSPRNRKASVPAKKRELSTREKIENILFERELNDSFKTI